MTRTAADALRILHLEDDDGDSELVRVWLERIGVRVDVQRTRTGPEFLAALREADADLVLSDFSLPGYDGMAALRATREARPELPFVLVTGTIGEERAVDAMKMGATDYVLKANLERLRPVVERALREADQRRQQVATERALADTRERMAFALDAAQVGIWEWDIGRQTVTWSGVTEQLHGYEPGAFPGTFDAAIESVHPEDRQQMLDLLQRAVPANPRFRLEYRVARVDGPPRWIASAGQIWHDEHGRPLRASGISHDVTVRRSLEDQLRQAQRLESIGGLAAGIAHDFNNLLNVILGYSEMLLERFAERPDVVADLSEVHRAAQSATALTRQLLAFSRRQILKPTVIDLSDVVRDTQKMLRRLIEENVSLDIHCAPAPLPVQVDVNQMEQVLLNLVVNARDAMPDGGAVTIETDEVVLNDAYTRTRHLDADIPPGRYARLIVSDTGTGIPADIQTRMFEPFFTTKDKGRGTGLGLATVYGIVKQSGGHIFLYSEVGVGTTFKIYMPMLQRADEQATAEAPRVRALNGQRILVVEDQPSLQMLISRMLDRANCEVVVASSAEEARQSLLDDASRIDLVLTDVVMPGDSGYVLAKWINGTRPGIPVICMTGYSEKAIARHAPIDSNATILQKPFSRDALVDTIERALSRED